MSKNIPKSIVNIGYSTKKKTSGELAFELNINKVQNLNRLEFEKLIRLIDEAKRQLMLTKRDSYVVGKTVLLPQQYEKIVSLIKQQLLLKAVKEYKEYTGTGLREAKDAIDTLKKLIKS